MSIGWGLAWLRFGDSFLHIHLMNTVQLLFVAD
jgi:hypothetical protein